MATLGTLEYLISINDSGIQSQLSRSESNVKGWGSKISAWTVAKGQMIGNFATKAIQTVGRVAKDTVKQAFQNFADYEQLVGGVDTLFKDSSQKVQDYAAKAYMTAGVSANKYMEMVTSFSASLLQSMGGDTSQAADVANMAMVDMSDNANKMGTSMESIQNAYQGFAKQNYTMLDNLKLGYGGTQKEMKRLLDDASKLTGEKYDIKNLSDVYKAIHAIQEEMGIAGTTQKEAMTTVSGSMNAAKAAWQDVLTAIGSGKDIKKTIKNFASTAKVALKNAAPVVRQAVEGLFSAAKELAPELGNIINEVGRGLFGDGWDATINWVQNAWTDVTTAFNDVKDWVSKAYEATVQWFNNAWNTVSGAFDDVKNWVSNAYKSTVEWINNAWDTVSGAFNDVTSWVANAFDATVNWIQNAWDDVSSAIAEVGKGVFDNVVNFTVGSINDVKKAIAQISKSITVAINFKIGSTGNPTVDQMNGDIGNQAQTILNNSTEQNQNAIKRIFGFAKGSWNVPFNSLAYVHRGETILNQSQARRYREGESGDNSINIPGVIARSVKESMKQVNFLLNGNKMADFTYGRTNRNIRADNYSHIRAYGG